MDSAAVEALKNGFINFYYEKFTSDRSQLASLYTPQSMLTWQNEYFLGSANIMEKLTEGLTFSNVRPALHNILAQPIMTGNGIFIFVSGDLVTDGEEDRPLRYSQTFVLFPDQTDSSKYYILNEIFSIMVN
eukprot:gnl/Dysnectes_brevis/164_a191_10656.p1 GENE.gnl/Dysnectes_brevis/164_a191_10656~~gnl/Dysnectes_brevis/164_a191_10656.p1  ORF type:complete len:131 (+),score=28.99 gnl/Dysnectes_brevis/164_a191_10656:10-402(+)